MENDVYKSPEAEIVTEEQQDNSALASRWSRLLAAIIDGLTIMPITVGLMYFTGGFSGVSEGIQPGLLYTFAIGIVGIFAFLIIHGSILLRDGQSWGKKAVNIKIVTADEQHADFAVLAKRYGFYWLTAYIPIIGGLLSFMNIVFIFSKTKRCIHDRIADTKVVNAY